MMIGTNGTIADLRQRSRFHLGTKANPLFIRPPLAPPFCLLPNPEAIPFLYALEMIPEGSV